MWTKTIALFLASGIATSSAVGIPSTTNDGTPPAPYLSPRTFEPLPLGSIAPKGWLLGQLLRQASSLSGYLSTTENLGGTDHVDSNIVNMSRWIGGNSSGPYWIADSNQWFPYWTDGNVPLVSLLKASNALDQLPSDLPLDEIIDGYMMYILDHDLQDGWIKHDMQWTPESSLQESGYQIVQTLMQWSETQPKYRKKVATAIISQLSQESTQIIPDSIQSWTATRWPSYITLISYAVDRLVPEFENDPEVFPLGAAQTTKLLIESADLMGKLGMDWHRYYNEMAPTNRTGNKTFPHGSVPIWNVYDHGVNNAEGAFRWPSALYRLNHSKADGLAEMKNLISKIHTYQGQIQSFMCADEVFCGRDPNRGTETCTVVEMMFSLEMAFATFGEVELFDLVERIAFNALPGALTGDMWTHVYVQQANSVYAGVSHPNSTEHPDITNANANANGHGHKKKSCERGACGSLGDGPAAYSEIQNEQYFGVSHFPCCITNFPQGWPKFAQNTVFVDKLSKTPTVVLASFVALDATIDEFKVKLNVDSQYPFGDVAHITVEAEHAAIDLKIRIPGWANRATVDGENVPNGTLFTVACPVGTTTIVLDLKPEVRFEMGWGDNIISPPTDAVGVVRGSLVFALHPKENKTVVQAFNSTPPRPHATDFIISTNDTWNYAIELGKGAEFVDKKSDQWSLAYPFDDSGEYPFYISVWGKQAPEWGYWNGSKITAAPPPSPVDKVTGESVELRLVPFGSTNIRISVFPWTP